MATPTETLWEIEPHTLAKHEIIRRYLGAWFPILGRYNPRVVYIDGFCGPGRYSGGEKGSPIIALELAINHQMQQKVQEATFIFIDERPDRIEHLRNEIQSLDVPTCLHVNPVVNQFDHTIEEILNYLDSIGARLAPTFAFVDPFGFKGIPYNLIQRLLGNQKTEVFINIMVDPINRFLESPDPKICQHIESLFGTPKVHSIIHSEGDRLEQLRELYQSQLKKIAKFVRYFEMRNDKNRIIYYLFFATNNRVGHQKMKEAFWKVDPSKGYRFSDRTDPCQPVLFENDPSDDLADELLKRFSGRKVNVSTILGYIEDETPYIASHMRRALIKLEDKEKIMIEPIKQDGKKRRGQTFPCDVIVKFPVAH